MTNKPILKDEEAIRACIREANAEQREELARLTTPDTEIERFKDTNPRASPLDGFLYFREEDVANLLTSLDTYWKERVEDTRAALLFIGEKVLREMSEIYAVDIKYADKKQWLEPSEFERIFLHRFNEAGLEALDTLLDNLK